MFGNNQSIDILIYRMMQQFYRVNGAALRLGPGVTVHFKQHRLLLDKILALWMPVQGLWFCLLSIISCFGDDGYDGALLQRHSLAGLALQYCLPPWVSVHAKSVGMKLSAVGKTHLVFARAPVLSAEVPASSLQAPPQAPFGLSDPYQ
jgi:hypothetical protein